MILIRQAFKNIRSELLIQCLTVLQLAAAIIVAIYMVSSVLLRYRHYTPFQDVFESKGLFCFFVEMANADLEGTVSVDQYLFDDQLVQYLDGADRVVSCNGFFGTCISDPRNCETISYDDEMIRRFQPELKEGRWLNESTMSEQLEIVVSENDYNWNVGKTLDFEIYNSPEPTTVSATIVGVIKDDTKIAGNLERYSNDDFNMIYRQFNHATEGCPIVIFPGQYLSNRIEKPIKIQGIYTCAMIVFKDNATEMQIQSATQLLAHYGCAFSIPLVDVNQNSKRFLNEKVYDMLPIIIVLLVMVVISSVSCSALAFKRNQRNYAIFYTCGLQWGHCGIISLIQAIILASVSLISACIGISIIQHSQYGSGLLLIIRPISIWIVFGIVFLFLLSSLFMPLLMLKHTTPKQIISK